MPTYKEQFQPWVPLQLAFSPVHEAKRIGMGKAPIIYLFGLAADARTHTFNVIMRAARK